MKDNIYNNLYNTKYDKMEAMKIEYSLLDKEEKSRYINLLTEWYMREKDILRNSNN
jgi:hypothetical protein